MKYDMKDCLSELDAIPCPLVFGCKESVQDPYFTVAIPTYKRSELLKNAIMSAVNQKNFDSPYEIIVVDNDESNNVNETEKMIRGMSIPNLLYYKNSRNIQASGNWNRCVLLARSEWVIMCHDDDWLKENCLSTMKSIIEKHTKDNRKIGFIRSSAESYYEKGIVPFKEQKHRKILKKSSTALIKRSYMDVIWSGGATWAGAPTCGTLINREAFIAVGGYNQDLSPCPDCYVPYHMLGKYGVYKTCHSYGYYRWSENDTYRKSTLIGLISAYNEFLEVLSQKHKIVNYFSNEHYADCVMYYRKKGKEANVEISDREIDEIRALHYSPFKLKTLYMIRKIQHGLELLLAN